MHKLLLICQYTTYFEYFNFFGARKYDIACSLKYKMEIVFDRKTVDNFWNLKGNNHQIKNKKTIMKEWGVFKIYDGSRQIDVSNRVCRNTDK